MRIAITGKNLEISDYLNDLVNKKVGKLEEAVGTRRGAESIDSITQTLRDMEKRLDKLERDMNRINDTVRRLERRN